MDSKGKGCFVLLTFFLSTPEALSDQSAGELLPTSSMILSARCASLSEQKKNHQLAEKHRLDYFSGAYLLGGLADQGLINQYHYYFGRSEGFISATAAIQGQSEVEVAAKYYYEMGCKDQMTRNFQDEDSADLAIEIAEETAYVKNLREEFPNLILEAEGKTEGYVQLYLGFDEGQGRKTRYGMLRVHQDKKVYRNKDYYLGTDDWQEIE